MQSHYRTSNLSSRPSAFPGSSNAGQSSSFASASFGQVSDLPTHLPSGEPIPIGDQLMQVDQAITLTLQEIDANFAKTHQIITARILPMIKRYGVASHNTWQGAKFWHKFFEAASDIHLAPPREQSTFDSTAEDEEEEEARERYAEEGEGQSFDRDEESMQSFQRTTPRRRQIVENDSYDIQDDSGELRHSHFEPPRVSDASIAATARLSRTGLGTSQSGRNVERTYGEDESVEFDQIGDVDIDPDSTKTARAGSRYVSDRDRLDTVRSTSSKFPKVQATPRRDSAKKNPFAKVARAPPAQQQQQPQASTSSSDTDAAKRSNSPRWNGIADLRKTPLSHINRSPVRKGAKAGGKSKSSTNIDEDDEDSLAWPAGMSPPVTMQFSVPRSRYNKTPAKEAAKLVVDDLLRTVESTTPAARRRLMQERQGGKEDVPTIGVRPRPIERLEGSVGSNNVVGTPLGTGKRRPNKGRTSMPTPPTVTKRVGGTIRASTSTQRESTPKSISNRTPSTASRLMDEDEEGQSLANEEDIPEDLGTGLSKLAINRPGAADGMDKLFEGDEDDSDNDMEDTDSEDEEDEYEGSALSSVRAPGAFPKGNATHTSSSIASVSHSIDEDTLFGIRDPSLGQKPHKSAASSQTPMVSNTSRAGTTTSSGQGKATNGPLSHQSVNPSLAAATPSANQYRPMGQVANLGTVYRGRPLLGEERDDTYSAPSPTPAAYSGGRPPVR